MDHDEIVRLYGPWTAHDPGDVVALFRGYSGLWWIAGGWAIEAFTEIPRAHGDLDISVPRADVAALRDHLRRNWDVWAAHRGSLTPMIDDEVDLPRTCSNLWLRRGGASPWEYDVMLMDIADGVWSYKREPSVGLPLDRILWERAGVRYLRPEIQLLYKAPGLRPQDVQDFLAALPRLEAGGVRWLRSALERAHPGHPWISSLTP